MKKTIALTINGRAVTAVVEPRTQLTDFVREQLLLTGTHLGCEHGVCGACTVEIDGAPARLCVGDAPAGGRGRVGAIEGLGDDPGEGAVAQRFPAEHALQCGYCT